MAFSSISEYERFIYSLQEAHPDVVVSTLRLYSTSALTGMLEGELTLSSGLVIRVLEVLDFKEKRIRSYSYAIYRDGVKLRWYDPQPHPENPDLAATFPHHYHEEPDIKHHRVPAAGVSFHEPNLLTIIDDCLQIG